MLDVTLFKDPRFSAASGAVTVTFFALFGFIFLITQYIQFIRGCGTLSTGARILPVALSIAVASVVGALLAPRIGTRAVVTTGLVLFGAAFVVDLHRRRRHVVPDRDRAADGDDGARHGLHLDAGDRVDPARAAAGPGRCRVSGQRRDARARGHARRRRGRLDLLLGVRRAAGRAALRPYSAGR